MSDINIDATSEPPLSPVVAALSDLMHARTIRDLLVDTDQSAVSIDAANAMIVHRWRALANAEIVTLRDAELLTVELWIHPGEFSRSVASDAILTLAAFFRGLWIAIDGGGASASDTLANAMIWPAEDPPPRASVPIVKRA